MKIKLLFICLLAVTTVTFGQQKRIADMSNTHFKKSITNLSASSSVAPLSSVAAPAAIWEDDCSSALTWVFTNTSTLGYDWAIEMDPNATPAGGALTPMASASASNGFMFISSDALGGTTDGDGTTISCEFTNATPIDLSAFPYVQLTFQHNFRWWHDTRVVRISGDNGATWVDIDEISNDAAYTYLNQSSDNPHMSTYDISSVAGGQSQVLVQFYYNDNDIWAWYWAVDDIAISEVPDNAISSTNEVIGGFWVDYANYSGTGLNNIVGLDYSHTPQSQLANHPFVFESIIKNTGIATQSVVLHYDVTGAGTGSGMSSAIVLNAQVDSAFSAAPSFGNATTPIGSYSVDIWAEADSAGAGITITTLPAVTKVFEVTDYIYGKDLGDTITPGAYYLGGPADQNHITTRYEMYANESLTGLRAFIHGNSVVGAQVKAVIYELDTTATDGLVFLDESDNYIITAQDKGAWVDIPFLSPISLFNGYAYEFGIAGFQHPTDSSFIGVSGTSMYNGEHSSFDEFGLSTQSAGTPTWYYMTSTPMVRMNFGPTTTSPSWDCNGGVCADPGTGLGAYASLSACQANCVVAGSTWNCSNGVCTDPGTGNGTYASQSACQSNCVLPSWDCDGQGNCYDPGTGTGTHLSLSACQSSCVTPTWDCIGGNTCLDPGTGQGAYTSLSACNTNCAVTPTWDCNNGVCSDPGTGLGAFTSQSACDNSCVLATWDCSNGVCTDPGTGNGTYASQSACQSNCVTPTWDCIGGNTCLDPGTGQGAYTSLSACNTNCAVTPTWDCNNGVCSDPGTGLGTFATLSGCQSNCVVVTPTWNYS